MNFETGVFPRRVVLVLLAAAQPVLAASSPAAPAKDRPNVLFIAADDSRPLLGCYGEQAVQTRSIDRLAARGTTFRRAYCQAPQCSPSRVSLMFGLRPDTTGHYSNRHDFDRERFRESLSLPEHFKNHGYHTQSFGKIYHDGADHPEGWSVPSSPGREREMWETVDEAAIARVEFAQRVRVPTVISPRIDCPAIQAPDVPDDTLYAGRMTGQAIAAMAAAKDRPFFLAVGYRRPHLPLVAPRKYFDKYPLDRIRLPEHRQPPAGAPLWSIYNSVTYWHPRAREVWRIDLDFPKYPSSREEALRFAGWELRSYRGIPPGGPISDPLQAKVWQAYLACVSYVDAQVGRLLEALETYGLSDKTIVVFWGDHGWHLGEHGTWAKMTLFEWATRVPLLIAAPGRSQPSGIESLVELVDLYPTLCRLADLPIPKHVEGSDLVPLLNDPDRPWKRAAFSHFPRHDHSLGQSMRTDRYRYTEWVGLDGGVKGRELYDHAADPLELVNLAASPASSGTVQQLARQMKAGWRAARPPGEGNGAGDRGPAE